MHNPATARLIALTNEAKAQLESELMARQLQNIDANVDWNANVWDLKNLTRDRNQDSVALNLLFHRLEFIKRDGKTQLKSNAQRREPLPLWLETFAKVVCAHLLCEQRATHVSLREHLLALRWLDHATMKHAIDSVHELLPHHLAKVKAALEKTSYTHETKYGICMRLAGVVDLINKFSLTETRLRYVNPYEKRAWKKKEDRTVPLQALDLLYHCINNPADDDERIIMEFMRLHTAAGDRVGETQTIPADSYYNGKGGALVELPRSQAEKGFNYGLRYLREKADGGIEIKPLDKGAYDAAKIAVDTLHQLCAPARARAKLLADMPGRFPLPKNPEGTVFYEPHEFITGEHLTELISVYSSSEWANERGIQSHFVTEARANGWSGNAPNRSKLYRVADIERACLVEMEDLTVLRHPDGTPKLMMHDLLCVLFENQLSFGEVKVRPIRRLFPCMLKKTKIVAELGCDATKRSMFDRRGITLANGEPVKIKTHATRHTRNKFLDEAGLSPIQQAQAMGRNPAQNEYYQGGSDINIIQQSHISRLQKTEHAARTSVVKAAVRERLIEGAITEAFHRLSDLNLVKAEEFLEEQVGQILVTRFGACTNEWSGQPCPKHNKCFKRCKSYHVTGSESERIELEKELNIQRLHRVKVKELADEKVYRADTALHILDTEIGAIEEALAQWQRAADRRKELEGKASMLGNIPISVQVYPDGVSHYAEVKRPGSAGVKGA